MSKPIDDHDHDDHAEPLASTGEFRNRLPSKSTKPLKIHPDLPEEVGGRDGPEPTRFGDWEVDGKCTDF